jgi:septum formation protein
MKLSFGPRNQANLPPPPPDVVLASQSVGRRALLEKLGLRFRVAVTRIDEEKIVDSDPLMMLKRRAAAKADDVVKNPRVYMIPEERETLLIAADSMAIAGRKTYGKANDREDAKKILKALMDRSHTFATAIVLVHLKGHKEKKRWTKTVKTTVTLRRLPTVELESYVARYDFTRFAAGYALNETPWDLVMKVDGSYTNVVGLPFEVLLPVLRQLKIIV